MSIISNMDNETVIAARRRYLATRRRADYDAYLEVLRRWYELRKQIEEP